MAHYQQQSIYLQDMPLNLIQILIFPLLYKKIRNHVQLDISFKTMSPVIVFSPSHHAFVYQIPSEGIPISVFEALSDLKWKDATIDEMQAFEKNVAWKLSDIPAGKRIAGHKLDYCDGLLQHTRLDYWQKGLYKLIDLGSYRPFHR